MFIKAIATPAASFGASIASFRRKYPNAEADINTELQMYVSEKKRVPAPPSCASVPGLGATVLKVRVRSSDQGRGRSGGFRVLLLHIGENEWRPLLAYAKTDREDVDKQDLLRTIKASVS